jgi:uncharacterized protein involved in copper resistance
MDHSSHDHHHMMDHSSHDGMDHVNGPMCNMNVSNDSFEPPLLSLPMSTH